MKEKELRLRYDDAIFWYNFNIYTFTISLAVGYFILSKNSYDNLSLFRTIIFFIVLLVGVVSALLLIYFWTKRNKIFKELIRIAKK